MQEIENANSARAGVASAPARSLSVAALEFVALLSVAVCAPALNMQAATGTLVNASLFIATVLLGVPAALLIGVIPSLISAVTGLLPAALLPMVPFIILGNSLLVILFSGLRRKSYFGAVALASLGKIALLSAASTFVIASFVSEKVAGNIALMMSYPQLLTALSGGALAYGVLGVLRKSED
jgi:hypothetical protein